MRQRILLLLALLLGILVAGLSCGRKPPALVPVPPTEVTSVTKPRPLEVAFASPRGTVEEREETREIVVGFNQPMVPLTGAPREEIWGPLKTEPEFPGKFRWRGSATLVFTPDPDMPYSAAIRATVPAGTRSLSGEVLKEDFTWTFETPRPRLLSSFPRHGDEWIPPGACIYLHFNQPMNPSAARDFLRLLETDKKGKTAEHPFSLRSAQADDLKRLAEGEKRSRMYEDEEETDLPGKWRAKNVLVMIPEGGLKKDCKYQVKILEGLPGAGGSLGMTSGKTISFSSIAVFRYKGKKDMGSIKPDASLRLIFSNPFRTKDLVANMTISPPVAIPDQYTEWNWMHDKVWLDLPFKPETRYRITISPKFTDKFQEKLGCEVRLKFRTTSFDPSVFMSEGKGILEALGDRNFPVGFMNVKRVRLQMASIADDRVIPLLNQENFLWSSEKGFHPESGFFKVDREWAFDTPKNKSIYLPVKIDEALAGRRYGIVYLQVDGMKELKEGARYTQALIQVTNLAITAKFSPDNVLVYVTALKDARPVPGADVEIRDDSNRVLWKGKTGQDGIVETPGWAPLGVKRGEDSWSPPKMWVFAYKDGDTAFISSEWGTGISPYDFAIEYNWNPQAREFAGHVFTERGLYRAGEEVHLKGTFREKKRGKWVTSSEKSLDFVVRDPRDRKIFKGKVEIDKDFGSFSHELSLRQDLPTGVYTVRYTLPGERGKGAGRYGEDFYFSTTFRVEAYEPAQFEVKVESPQKEYVFKEPFSGNISGWYLFGSPMSGERVSWRARLMPEEFIPPGYDGYDFGPCRWLRKERDEPKDLASGEGKLDEQGKIAVSTSIEQPSFRGSARLVVEGTVTSPIRQTLSGRKTFTVHRGRYYIGLRPSSSFLPTGKEMKIGLVAVEPSGAPTGDKKISVEIIQRVWHSVRKVGVGGAYEWVVEEKDKPLRKDEIRSRKGPKEILFKPESPGFYIVKAEAQDDLGNRVFSESTFYASGRGYVPWARSDDDRIELVSDKRSYKPGDVARILVKSPYERAKALVTLERELIIHRFVTEVVGSAEAIEIPITEEYLPNVFVSVALLQGRLADAKVSATGEDLGKPSFKIGYVNLPVDPGGRKLKVQVKTDREDYRPGDTVRVEIVTRDARGKGVPAEVCLAAVDLGVLNLIGYETPDYFDSFYGSRPLSVATSETRLCIIGQKNYGEKGDTRGGGGGAVEGFPYRTEFKATAYWNSGILTDREGRASVIFKLGDNLTTFRVMAIAQTKDSSFGSAESRLAVNKPLMIQPSIPRFAMVGDDFSAGVMVFNGTKSEGKVKVEAETSGLTLKGDAKKQIRIAPGKAQEVLFSYLAEKSGDASLAFSANMGEERDGLKIHLPVKVPRYLEAAATSGDTLKAEVREELLIPPDIYPDMGGLEALTSSTALVGLKGGLDFLLHYPYECLEQKVSRLLPLLVAEEMVNAFDLPGLKGEELRRTAQKMIAEIESMQLESGGFTLWSGGKRECEYVSAYAMYALARARERGYAIKSNVALRGKAYLSSIMRQSEDEFNYPYTRKAFLATKAFALYAMALWDKRDPGYPEWLYEKKSELPLCARVHLLLALHKLGMLKDRQKTVAQEMLNMIKIEPTMAHFEESDPDGLEWVFHSNVRTTAMVLSAMLQTGSEFPYAPNVVKWLMQQQKEGRWNSTQENIYVLDALNTYFRMYEKETPDLKATIGVEQKKILEAMFKGRTLDVKREEVPLRDFKRGERLPLKIERKGRGRLYYTIRMRYAPRGPVMPKDEGISVTRIVTPLRNGGGEAGVLDTFRAGKLYKVTLSVMTPQERTYVALEDPVPAGFQVLNTAFATESDRMKEIFNEGLRKRRKKQWMGTFDAWEIYDEKVLLFADYLARGEHSFTYIVKAVHFGDYMYPAAKAEEMYFPEVFGCTGQKRIRIK